MTVTLGVPCFDTCELFTHFFAWRLPQVSPLPFPSYLVSSLLQCALDTSLGQGSGQ